MDQQDREQGGGGEHRVAENGLDGPANGLEEVADLLHVLV